MNTISTILATVLMSLAVGLVGTAGYSYAKFKVENTQPVMAEVSIPVALQANMTATSEAPVKAQASKKESVEVITLTEDNMVTLDQAFTDESVTQVMQELQKLSDRLDRDDKIYLVLNSPGGSISAGLSLLSFVKALPQKVKTLTIFAASMGFDTVQGLDERLILDTGTLMSHQASFVVRGETEQVKVRLKYYLSLYDAMDVNAAERMQMSVEAYKALINDEYWVYGKKAVLDKAADRVVLARCGKGTSGTKNVTVETPFGGITVQISRCPLLPGILGVTEAGSNQSQKAETENYVKMMFNDKRAFVEEVILKNKYENFFNRK